jgi:triacylglycerol lipase
MRDATLPAEAGNSPLPGSQLPVRVRWWQRRKARRRKSLISRQNEEAATLPSGHCLVPSSSADGGPQAGNGTPTNDAVKSLRFETRIGGTLLETEVQPRADGRFEALLAVDLPNTGRGWRLAKNRLSWDNQAVEASGVVLQPPAQAAEAVVVVLPLEFSYAAGDKAAVPFSARWAKEKWAGRLPEFLRGKATADIPIYYLAGVPAGLTTRHRKPVSQAELALAATALGWPGGDFILLPAESGQEQAALTTAVDRLRWLFADGLSLVLLNLERSLTPALDSLIEARPDRAPVKLFIDAEGHPVSGSQAIRPRISHPGEFRPSRGEMLTRHPVVFCHGMLAFSMLKMAIPENHNCFSVLRQPLRDRGYRVFFPQVPPTSGVAERAAQLREQILRWTDEPVNLIAHSMGGLDARYMTSRLDMADHVVTLTTVGTPHHGSYLADWFLTNYRKRVPLLLALEAFGFNVDGFKACRPAVCREFNAATPDIPTVRYFSYGGDVPQSRLSPFLRRAWHILGQVEGPNDGMVSVASARWGQYLGTVHADHFAQTPDATFLRKGEDFDAAAFFMHLVEELARQGF